MVKFIIAIDMIHKNWQTFCLKISIWIYAIYYNISGYFKIDTLQRMYILYIGKIFNFNKDQFTVLKKYKIGFKIGYFSNVKIVCSLITINYYGKLNEMEIKNT